MLGGNSVFVRAITWNNDYLETKVSLAGSDRAIKRVFDDCDLSFDAVKREDVQSYTLSDFTVAFKKLSKKDQKSVLISIEKMMEGLAN